MSKWVLWLAGWYPSRVDPFNGDFIERHAHSVSEYVPLKLIYVVRDLSLQAGEVNIEVEKAGRLTVYRGYYNVKPGNVFRLASFRVYMRLHKKLFRQIQTQFGLPAVTHVHIAYKAGLFARYLRKKWGIPYVVSEHWSGYYKENRLYGIHRNGVQKLLTRRVLNGASYILPVSESLGSAIARLSDTVQIVVPNVVDTSLFYFRGKRPAEPVLVHISNMAKVKNAEAILRACVQLHKEGRRFKLIMVGGAPAPLVKLALSLEALNVYVFFREAVPYAQVPVFLSRAKALVLFSEFETQSCVALEALCCGVPVIAPSVGGLPEIINHENGILIKRGDEEELKEAMRKMLLHCDYNQLKISSKAAEEFGMMAIGKKICEVYGRI